MLWFIAAVFVCVGFLFARRFREYLQKKKTLNDIKKENALLFRRGKRG